MVLTNVEVIRAPSKYFNLKLNTTVKQKTLEELLEWQKAEREEDELVFTDGTACCQTGKDFEIHYYGNTPREALQKAFDAIESP